MPSQPEIQKTEFTEPKFEKEKSIAESESCSEDR